MKAVTIATVLTIAMTVAKTSEAQFRSTWPHRAYRHPVQRIAQQPATQYSPPEATFGEAFTPGAERAPEQPTFSTEPPAPSLDDAYRLGPQQPATVYSPPHLPGQPTHTPQPSLSPASPGCTCGAHAVGSPTIIEPAPSYAWQPVAPVFAMPPAYHVGRGILGQPTVYVPGQPVRNFFRFLSP